MSAHTPTGAPALALTFDDGPDPVWTGRLLDLLGAAGATATFFVIASRAERHPGVIGRMLAEGHRVELHCDEHERHSRRDESWVRADTVRGLGRLRALGATPSRWRTPWGDTAPFTSRVARAHALTLTGWTVDTHDWRGDPAAEMFAATRPGLTAGAVVLAHDGIGPGARRRDAGQTVAYVARVIAWAAGANLPLRAL